LQVATQKAGTSDNAGKYLKKEIGDLYQHRPIVGGGMGGGIKLISFSLITFPATLDPQVLKAMLLKAQFLKN